MNYEKLETLMYRRSARQRVILYLLATGYTVPNLVNMSSDKLFELMNNVDYRIKPYFEETLETKSSESSKHAFIYGDGRPFSHNEFYRIVRQASKSAIHKNLSVSDLQEYIK